MSGSRLSGIVLVALLLCTLPACSVFRPKTADTPAKRPSPDAPARPPREERNARIDTIQWKSDPAGPGPIRSEQKTRPSASAGTRRTVRSVYKVAFLLPLYSSVQKEQLNDNVLKMVHFLSGMRMAEKSLAAGSPEIQWRILDVEAYADRMNTLIRKDSLAEYDIVVGPYKTEHLQELAKYCREEGKLLISPWNTAGTITSDNPYYIQMRPGIRAHCEAIASELTGKYRMAQVQLVAREKDERERSYFDFIRKTPAFQKDALLKKNTREWLLKEEDGRVRPEDFAGRLSETGVTVFVLPYWSQEAFVLQFLNTLAAAMTDKHQVVVFGLPQWLSFPNLGYDLLDRLNVRLSSNHFMDIRSAEVKTFRSDFFERNGVPPLEDAYYGYDLVYWLAKVLKQPDEDWQVILNRPYDSGLFNKVDLIKMHADGAPVSDDFSKFDYYENKTVRIIRLQDYRFQLEEP